MRPKGIHNGLVAFFDILGFKAINENNEIEKVAEIVAGVLERLPKNVKRSQNQAWKEVYRILQPVKTAPFRIKDHVSDLLLSDSMLLTAPVSSDGKPDNDKELSVWLIFS